MNCKAPIRLVLIYRDPAGARFRDTSVPSVALVPTFPDVRVHQLLSLKVRPSGLSLVLSGTSAAPKAPLEAAILSSAGLQQDGSTAARMIMRCIAVRSHDVRMPASRAVFVH